ncbi:MAG TPA: hypothetical protein VF650_08500 [Allosphingosinicella sp.]
MEIFRDIEGTGAEVLLPRLIEALAAQLEESTEETQQAVVAVRQELEANLAQSRFNEISHTISEQLATLGIEHLLGNALFARISAAFEGNQITPSVALASLRKLNEELQELYKHSDGITDAFAYFQFEDDELPPGDFEVMVAIPGKAVECQLGQLGREAVRINQILGVFSELATGSREQTKIRAISSSDFTFYLETAAPIAAMAAVAFERIATLYERILGVIKLHREMKTLNLPTKIVDPIKQHIEAEVQKGLEEIAKRIEKEHLRSVDQGRKQELKTELRQALRGIAQRMDNGYGFDVRGEEFEQPADAAEGEAAPTDARSRAASAAMRIIEESRPKLKHFRAEGEPVLGLPPPSNDDSTTW